MRTFRQLGQNVGAQLSASNMLQVYAVQRVSNFHQARTFIRARIPYIVTHRRICHFVGWIA
jgi:hypothetical protein